MTKVHNIESQGVLKNGLIAALVVTISIAVLVGTTNISTAGAKNTKNPTGKKYSKASKKAKKGRARKENWGNICNDYGPLGSINAQGKELPKECTIRPGDTFNPFGHPTIYDRY